MKAAQMKKISVLTTVVATLAVIAGSVVAVNSASATPSNTHESTISTYSPEQVFEGVYFLQGDVGRDIYQGSFLEQLNGFSTGAQAVNTARITSFTDEVVSQVKQADPSFLAHWTTRIESGDPYTVAQALMDGHAAMNKTPVVQQTNKKAETYVPGDVGPDCATAVVVAAGFVIAAGLFVVEGAVGIQVVAFGYNVFVADNAVYTHSSTTQSQDDQATQEWNALVTSRLAV